MKKQTALTTGTSQPEVVDEFIASLKHPMTDVVRHLRKFILAIDSQIGEGIFWNGPTFYFTGKMAPFDPKEYRRYIVGVNLYRTDTLRLVFLRGADAEDPSGILEGSYSDGRRIVSIAGLPDLKSKEGALKRVVKQLIRKMA